MKTGIRGWFGAALGGALLLVAGCVTTPVAAEEPSEPTYTERAARLSYIDGGVRVALEGGSEWVEPRLNLPLAGSDRLRTDRDARAELRWDRGALRLDGGSEAELDRMSEASVRIWLARGVAALQVRALDEAEQVAVGTEAGVIEVLRPGNYRIEADDRDGDTLLIVRDGLAEFRSGERSVRVHAGEMLRLRRGEDGEARVAAAFGRDGFDRWCEEREARIERSVSSRYVPAGIVGYEDLDAYGRWDYAVGFGYVWYPSGLAPGWTPYAFGNWVWVSPWGWTWIDSSPWGYAPYHYGNWTRYRGRWCWVPGPRHERPRYRPAPQGWRHERPIQAGDGHVYRPPAPPRAAPPRQQRPRENARPREDRRISIPERPVSPTPPRGVPRTGEPPRTTEPPRTAEPEDSRWTRGRPAFDERDRERPVQSRQPSGAQPRAPTVPAVPAVPVAAPRVPESPATGRPQSAPRSLPTPRLAPPQESARQAPQPAPQTVAPSAAPPAPAVQPPAQPAAQPQQPAPTLRREREPRDRDFGQRR
jgi:hypothetical protein